jgi:A/G-specific adenine glycosylase
MISQQKITDFQKKILHWYSENQRDLPWRETRDPYRILVSEVMSQQTQLSRVIPKYKAWIEKFPTVQKLAEAKIFVVLQYWSGLGYNRRALNLKKAAEVIVEKYGGKFPVNEKELMSLSGIGQYTARAVLCFASNQQIAVVDTNVRKVILTQFGRELGIKNYELGINKKNENHNSLFIIRDSMAAKKVTDKDIERIAQMLLPNGRAYEWNQALMDYAAAMLKKEKIPIPKQSKFHGSRRYYRGQILKQLLEKKKISVTEIGFLIKKDYTEVEKDWLQQLLKELTNEGFIVIKSGVISLAA